MTNKKLSIILPVYNENEGLELMVKILTHSLDFEHEILIIYDTQDDLSIPIAKKLETTEYDLIETTQRPEVSVE